MTSHGRMTPSTRPELPSAPETPTVVILGGGLSGAAVAWHLARRTRADTVRIIVVEPRPELGRGLAYSTADPDHRLNVPDHKMTLDTSDPLHFQRWLLSAAGPGVPYGARTADGDAFVPRAVFGQYVAAFLQPELASGRIIHLRARAVGGRQHGEGYRLKLDTGAELHADLLVLAIAHPPPTLPGPLAALEDDPRLITDAYDEEAIRSIAPSERVLIVGSGLTGADVIATLHRRVHEGALFMLSRHGRRSQPHGPSQSRSPADFTAPAERKALDLLRRVRRDVAFDAARGRTWHAVFDRVREQAPHIWAALPLQERQKVLRHLRGLWDIHRFRIAPQTHAVLTAKIATGRLEPLTGRIEALQVQPERLLVEVQLRDGHRRQLELDRIVLATGPAHGSAIATNPVLADLARHGLIQADPLGLGIWASPQGHALDGAGAAQPGLLVAGPLGRGAVGELMGVPEITARAQAVAAMITKALAVPSQAAVTA